MQNFKSILIQQNNLFIYIFDCTLKNKVLNEKLMGKNSLTDKNYVFKNVCEFEKEKQKRNKTHATKRKFLYK